MIQEAGARIPISDEEARAHLAAIIDSTDDAILSKTREGIVTSWNRGAERLYGYLAEEAIGRPISFLVPPERLDELQQITETILRGERVDRLETERISKDGRRIMVSLTLSPIYAPDGSIIGVSTIARDITKQKLMERSLQESEKRYRTLVEMAPEAVVVHQDGSFVYANCAALGIFGARALDQLQHNSLLDLVHPDDREAVRDRISQLLDGEEIPLRECRLRRLTGEEVSVEASSTLIDYHGRPSIQIIARDITERKRAEQERESMLKQLDFERLRFETVVQQMPIGLVIAEAPSGRVLLQNEHSRSIFRQQLPLENLDDYQQWRIYHNDGLLLSKEEYPLARAVSGETISGEEFQIGRSDGTLGFVSVNASPIRDASGQIVAAVVAFNDITDRKSAAEALRRSEQRFRLMTDSMPQIAWTANPDGSIDYINANFELYTGIQRDAPQIVDNLAYPERLILALVHPDDAEPTANAWLSAVHTGEIYQHETRIRRADGAYHWHLSRAIPARDDQGVIVKWYGTATDVNDLRETQEKLRASEATLKLAVEVTGLGIFDLDLRSGKGIWSDIAKRHYGLPPEAEADLSVLMSGVHPEERERIKRIAQDATRPGGAGAYSAEYRTIGVQDRKLRWLTMRARQLLDERGEPARLVGACIDITDFVKAEKALKDEITERLRAVEELRKQEQLLIRQARLAAMGEMVGNIAHQWRQPLNTLGLIVQELPRYYEANLFSKDYLEASVTRAMQVINYMSKTIDGFRNFFGPDKEKEEFNASEVLARTVSIVEAAFNQLKLRIEVNDDQDAVIYGCPNEFSQVILNILMNAKDALTERNIKEPRVVVRLFRENERLVLTIADNAGGIEPQIMDKIFDPYFTTKGPDKGTGIGLFMSKTIIEKNMNGALTVRNTEQGAEFRIEV